MKEDLAITVADTTLPPLSHYPWVCPVLNEDQSVAGTSGLKPPGNEPSKQALLRGLISRMGLIVCDTRVFNPLARQAVLGLLGMHARSGSHR
jgi:hypothetical protein